jgi:coenzyme Q-binding protein COQ10
MPKFSTTRRVRHSAEDMFNLVADVEKYPSFVPLCQALTVRRRSEGEGDTQIVIAGMTVAYKLLRETFTSRVKLDRQNQQIDVTYLDGPFSRMENRWKFTPKGEDSCDVQFSIDYEFKSRVLGMMMGAMFDAAFRRFSAAFEARADEVYGKRA